MILQSTVYLQSSVLSTGPGINLKTSGHKHYVQLQFNKQGLQQSLAGQALNYHYYCKPTTPPPTSQAHWVAPDTEVTINHDCLLCKHTSIVSNFNDEADEVMSFSFLTTHIPAPAMTHTLTRQSTYSWRCARWRWTCCILWGLTLMEITAFWCVSPCSLAERYQCCHGHFLPPSGYKMKAAGSYVTIPLCQTTRHHITQGNHFHASFFLTPIPVGSQKRMCWDHTHSLIRHHLEWHPVTAACKNTVHYFQL
jgi:hypothetical protein